ncbi:hypothetical protein EP7_000920 [Isosphaeraceae bacterium EP7]
MKSLATCTTYLLAAVLLATTLITIPATARAETFITVDVPGASSTTLNGINDLGDSTGSFVVGSSTFAFTRSTAGVISAYSILDSTATYANGIDNLGRVVGSYFDGAATGAYIREADGSFATFFVPGSTSTFGNGISSDGSIAGTYSLSTGLDFHSFIRAADGTFTTFDVPGAVWTFAQGVNASGQVVGSYFDGFSFHGYLRDPDGTIQTLDAPGSLASFINGINITGDVIGSGLIGYFNSSGPTLISSGLLGGPTGMLVGFNVPGADTSTGQGINGGGLIVGSYTAGGITHGFITVVPEPGTFVLCGTAIIALIATRAVALGGKVVEGD